MLQFLIYAIGFITTTYLLIKLILMLYKIIYVHILAERFGHLLNLSTFGKWAVITGSTDGIGKGYALGLARRGINVFLISRNQDKLNKTAEEIKNKSPNVEIRTLAFDFTNSDLTAYSCIKEALNGLEVGILVNNVGIAMDKVEYFLDYPESEKLWKNMIDVNCLSAVQLTRFVLPSMLKKHKGIIINVSSSAGCVPIPMISVYSATKSFLRFFTLALNCEYYANSGIIFQNVHPYFVSTNMTKNMEKNFFIPDGYYYADRAINTIGLELETAGCLSHAIQHAIVGCFTQKLHMNLAKMHFLDLRRKYEEFLAKEAKKQL